MSTIGVDRERCILCGACVDTCPAHIFFEEQREIKTRYEEYCIGCGHCAAVCPEDAVLHTGLDLAGFLPIPAAGAVSFEALTSFLRSRRSCRAYLDKDVDKETIDRLIDTARFSPTGHNAQNVAYVVVREGATIKRLSGLAAEFYGNLAAMVKKSPDKFPPTVREMVHSFELNYDFFKAGKDRIFRGARAVVLTHAPAENPSSIDNCVLAALYVALAAHGMGLGGCINRYFISAAEYVPAIGEILKIPAENKLYGCVTLGWPAHAFVKIPARKRPDVTFI